MKILHLFILITTLLNFYSYSQVLNSYTIMPVSEKIYHACNKTFDQLSELLCDEDCSRKEVDRLLRDLCKSIEIMAIEEGVDEDRRMEIRYLIKFFDQCVCSLLDEHFASEIIENNEVILRIKKTYTRRSLVND
jgi:hypothetical protein